MIDEWVGMGIIVGALIFFVFAQSPLMSTLLGGEIGAQFQWAASNIYWIIPAGILIYSVRSLKLYAVPVAIAAGVGIWLFLQYGMVAI